MNGPELIEELRAEGEGLRETLSRLVEIRSSLDDRPPTHVELTAMAAYLANLYGGLERMLIRIVKHSGLPSPEGPSWHRD